MAPAAIGVRGSGSVPRCGLEGGGGQGPGRRGPGGHVKRRGPAGRRRGGAVTGAIPLGHPEEAPSGGERASGPFPFPLGPGPFPSPAAA